MRLTPKDVHRQVLSRRASTVGGAEAEPDWYALWLGEPEAEDSELLGRIERLDRPRWWRAYPASGKFPKSVRGYVETVHWLLEQRTISQA